MLAGLVVIAFPVASFVKELSTEYGTNVNLEDRHSLETSATNKTHENAIPTNNEVNSLCESNSTDEFLFLENVSKSDMENVYFILNKINFHNSEIQKSQIEVDRILRSLRS